MRILLSILLCLFFMKGISAQDTIFIKGAIRQYDDSIVFRWNTTDGSQYLELSRSILKLEIKTSGSNSWIGIADMQPANPDAFASIGQHIHEQTIIAAAALKQMRTQMDNAVDDPASAIQKKQDIDFFWMNLSLAADLHPYTANKCNLRYAITKSKDLQDAVFRLYVQTNTYISDTLYLVPGSDMFRAGEIGKLEAYEKENEIELKWNSDPKYSAYFVEKSELNGRFKRINRAPIIIPATNNIQLYYKDSVTNYQAHSYRIYAVDMFGDPSLPSSVLKAMGRDRTPPSIPSGLKITETSDKQLILSWDAIASNEGSKGLAIGMRHMEGHAYKPLEKQLLPLNTNRYTTPIIESESDYYFILQVFDTANNSSSVEAFYQLNDNTAPNAPTGLTAQSDKKGIVTIKWKSNKEKDLQGYLIYTSTHLKSEFSGIVNVPISDTFFMDTLSLKLLNKDVYYRVVAVDHRLNRSQNSESVKVLRPDTLAPVSPVFVSFQSKDTSIQLRLITSSSDDVKQNYLVRQQKGSKQSTIIHIQAGDTLYLDKGLKENTTYTYYMYAEDWSGNLSPKSEILELTTLKNYYKPAVKLFTVEYDSLRKQVDITWQYDMSQVRKIWIYKGPSPGEMSKIPEQVKERANTFSDKRVKTGEWYYAIKLYFNDGTETWMSIPLGVIIR